MQFFDKILSFIIFSVCFNQEHFLCFDYLKLFTLILSLLLFAIDDLFSIHLKVFCYIKLFDVFFCLFFISFFQIKYNIHYYSMKHPPMSSLLAVCFKSKMVFTQILSSKKSKHHFIGCTANICHSDYSWIHDGLLYQNMMINFEANFQPSLRNLTKGSGLSYWSLGTMRYISVVIHLQK